MDQIWRKFPQNSPEAIFIISGFDGMSILALAFSENRLLFQAHFYLSL